MRQGAVETSCPSHSMRSASKAISTSKMEQGVVGDGVCQHKKSAMDSISSTPHSQLLWPIGKFLSNKYGTVQKNCSR